MLKTKKTRGPSKPLFLPSDWYDSLERLLWPIFEETHLNANRKLPFDKERFQRYFGIPSRNTLGPAKTDNVIKQPTWNRMAESIRKRAGAHDHKIAGQDLLETIRSMSRDQRAAPAVPERTGGLQVFLDRKEIMSDFEMMRVLDTCHGLDMIALSAAIANSIFGLSLRAALRRPGFNCRFALFDPSARTAEHYDTFVRRVIEESPLTKRGQFEELYSLAQRHPQQIQIKVIRDLPLMYNAWIARDESNADYRAHISIYMYEAESGGPAVRISKENPLVARIRQEFDFVWNSVAVPFESAEVSKPR
jgi:hypothetical protein